MIHNSFIYYVNAIKGSEVGIVVSSVASMNT